MFIYYTNTTVPILHVNVNKILGILSVMSNNAYANIHSHHHHLHFTFVFQVTYSTCSRTESQGIGGTDFY